MRVHFRPCLQRRHSVPEMALVSVTVRKRYSGVCSGLPIDLGVAFNHIEHRCWIRDSVLVLHCLFYIHLFSFMFCAHVRTIILSSFFVVGYKFLSSTCTNFPIYFCISCCVVPQQGRYNLLYTIVRP